MQISTHRLPWSIAGFLFGLLITGCISSSLSPEPTMMPAPPPLVEYENPVFPRDFPDPFILRVGDVYYGYATNARHMNIQVIRSIDLISWERVGEKGDALPQLPEWTAQRQFLTWAPSMLHQDGEFILYYTARYQDGGRQCISYAIGETPEGPFVDTSDKPFICQLDEGGSIDPEPLRDADGTTYLLWKNDGNCCDLPVWIYSQQLSDDGRSLVGEPHRLIAHDQEWENPLIENPSMIFHDGHYILVYSANRWDSNDYAVGYAICKSPTGPCNKPQEEAILTSAGDSLGPGGASFFTDTEQNLWLAYHAWIYPNVGYPVGQRRLHLARVVIYNGDPIIYRPENE